MPTEAHQIQLGRLCTAFQGLEVRLCFVTWCLISNDMNEQRIGQIITSNMSFARICKTLAALAKFRYGESSQEASEIESIVKDCLRLEQRRNQVIHSYWTAPSSAGDSLRIKFGVNKKNILQVSENETSPQEISEIASEMKALSNRLIPICPTGESNEC